jgi:ammonium transporter, Amt family
MSAFPQQRKKPSLAQRFSRLVVRLRDPEWQRYGKLLLLGKAMGVGVVLLVITVVSALFFGRVYAADAEVKAADIVNPINTIWTLIAAFLVFGMQVGFTMLEAGFCRSRETVNVLMECIVDTCLCGLLFYAFGFAFMFSHGNGFIGYHWFFLKDVPATYESTGVAFLAFWLFQFAFADTCSTITSGAMIGRTGFVGDLLYSVAVSGFIYPIIGHWAWGPDGFLALMGSDGHFFPSLGTGFHDFAGSTVVHTIGGVIALAGSIVLGPRLGRRFKRDGGGPMLPHDLTIAATGGLLLWFGWYGFNPGSTLSAMIYAYSPNKKWDVSFTINGFLAGLVAITCPCYWVSPTGAILLGGVAGVLVVAGVEVLEWLRIDDPIGAVPVHGMCGIWGTLSLGLFACGKYGATGPVAPDNSVALKGLLYGGGGQLLLAQTLGSLIITTATFAVAYGVMRLVNATGTLRVSRAGELYGLDLHEHGISAYPEYVISSAGTPVGLVDESESRPARAVKFEALILREKQNY